MSDSARSSSGGGLSGFFASMKASLRSIGSGRKKGDDLSADPTPRSRSHKSRSHAGGQDAGTASGRAKKLSDKGKDKLAEHRAKERIAAELAKLEQVRHTHSHERQKGEGTSTHVSSSTLMFVSLCLPSACPRSTLSLIRI